VRKFQCLTLYRTLDLERLRAHTMHCNETSARTVNIHPDIIIKVTLYSILLHFI